MNIQLQNLLFYPAHGGIETLLWYLAKELNNSAHQGTVFCSQHQKGLARKDQHEGISVIRHPRLSLPVPFSVFNPVLYVTMLERYLRETRASTDVIWSGHPYYCYASTKVWGGKKPVIYLQAFPFPEFLRRNFARAGFIRKTYINCLIPQARLIEKQAIARCDRVAVVSESEREEISKFYRVSPEKIVVVPPGVDSTRFCPRKKDSALLAELGLDRETKIVLVTGRITEQKNLEHLIRAFAHTRPETARLVIVGDGWQRPYLERLTKELGQEKRVIFTGWRGDTERFYALADVFALPSHYEGFGQVFLEAMASGIPCIGLKRDYPRVITATDEIITDGKDGYSVNPYSEDALKDRLETLLRDEALRQSMGAAARMTCLERFTWKQAMESLLRLSGTGKSV